jgi:hypothetical protein
VASPLVVDGRVFVTGQNQNEEPIPPFGEVAGKHDADRDGCMTAVEVDGTWMAEHVGWLDVDASGCVSADDWSPLEGEWAPTSGGRSVSSSTADRASRGSRGTAAGT